MGLSQSQVIDILGVKSEFLKIDKGTYSRWENGKTKPSIRKQVRLLQTISDLETATDYSRTIIQEGLIEQSISKKRFCFPSKNPSDSFYNSDSEIIIKLKNIDEDINSIISDSYNAQWGHEYSDLHRSLCKEQVNEGACIEYYDLNGFLLGHHMMYLGTVEQLSNVLINLGIRLTPNLNHTELKKNEKVVAIACSYSSSEAIFWFNTIKTIEYCLDNAFNAETLYFKVHCTATKEYLEHLGATVYAYGPTVEVGLQHYKINYKWLGLILPFSNILTNYSIYKNIINELNVSFIEKT